MKSTTTQEAQTMPATFEYSTRQMMAEYDEMEAAKAEHEGDPVAQLLIEQEGGARMALGDDLRRLREEAERLARRALRIVSMIDERGLSYTPNSLGEIQSHQVDVQCAKVYAASTRLESVQRELRKHLES
jgi:hypothetical protein